jgi:hypothetical protein
MVFIVAIAGGMGYRLWQNFGAKGRCSGKTMILVNGRHFLDRFEQGSN